MRRSLKWMLAAAAVMAVCFLPSPASATAEFVPRVQLAEETAGSGDFISGALGSLDEETAAEETDENYMKNFYNSTQTVMTEGLNLFRPHTIVMTLLNVITMLLELLGSVITFFVMVLYNFVGSSFMMTMVDGILESVESVMFDWSDYNSWIIKVVVLVTLIGILYQLIKNFTRLHGYKQILQVIVSGLLSMGLIIFIGQSGRTIMFGLDSLAQDVLVDTFVFDGQSENMEIANKENIFEIMQMQPFMLRHYGTVSYEAIAESAGQSEEDARYRVQTLLEEPTEVNARIELDDYGNTAISHDIASCAQVLFLSFMGLLHRLLIGIVIAVLAIGVGVVKLLKMLLMFLSVYQLLWWLIRRTHRARQWFLDRITWSLLAIGADLVFNVAMYFIMEACVMVSVIHPLLMIAFDVILLVLCVYAAKHIGTIAAKLRDGGDLLQAALVGRSPGYAISDFMRQQKRTDEADQADDASSVPEDVYDPQEGELDGLNAEDLSDQDVREENDGSSSENEETAETADGSSETAAAEDAMLESSAETDGSTVDDEGTVERSQENEEEDMAAEETIAEEESGEADPDETKGEELRSFDTSSETDMEELSETKDEDDMERPGSDLDEDPEEDLSDVMEEGPENLMEDDEAKGMEDDFSETGSDEKGSMMDETPEPADESQSVVDQKDPEEIQETGLQESKGEMTDEMVA